MKFNQILTEAPLELTSDKLKVWNVEQMKVWEKVKEKYNFMEFAKKFDQLYSKYFKEKECFPSIEDMIKQF